MTILVTTHYMDEAENCDRLALMNRGKIVAHGTPQGIKRLAYGGDIVELYTERRALLYLKSFDGVKTILNKDVKDGVLRVKVLVDDASDRLVPIVKNLEEKGVKVLRANQVFVSLEDAFIKLTVGD